MLSPKSASNPDGKNSNPPQLIGDTVMWVGEMAHIPRIAISVFKVFLQMCLEKQENLGQ